MGSYLVNTSAIRRLVNLNRNACYTPYYDDLRTTPDTSVSVDMYGESDGRVRFTSSLGLSHRVQPVAARLLSRLMHSCGVQSFRV